MVSCIDVAEPVQWRWSAFCLQCTVSIRSPWLSCTRQLPDLGGYLHDSVASTDRSRHRSSDRRSFTLVKHETWCCVPVCRQLWPEGHGWDGHRRRCQLLAGGDWRGRHIPGHRLHRPHRQAGFRRGELVEDAVCSVCQHGWSWKLWIPCPPCRRSNIAYMQCCWPDAPRCHGSEECQSLLYRLTRTWTPHEHLSSI